MTYSCQSVSRCCSLLALGLLVMGTAQAEPPAFPVRQIVLFNTGVGYFQHRGEVEGDASVELKLPPRDVDDLLKTLVLEDEQDGTAAWVSYAAVEDLETRLQSLGVDLAAAPTLAELLQQFRGERLRVDGPVAAEGTLVGLEVRDDPSGGVVREREYLNLLTADGLRSLPLDQVVQCRLIDEALQRQLEDALRAVATERRAEERLLTLRFRGEGRRTVRAAYVRATPVWKSSHRLSLGGDGAATLQSWAIVENTGEHDWEQVRLALVSGSPVSFEMPLEAVHEVGRVQLPLPVAGSPAPRRHEVASLLRERRLADIAAAGGGFMGRMGGGMGGMGGYGGQRPFVTSIIPIVGPGGEAPKAPVPGEPLAVGAQFGEFYRHDIEQLVTLRHGESALVPIATSKVQAERISIYTPGADERRLQLAMRLVNSTDGHWSAGPVTVYDEGLYVGEAQLVHTAPKGTRLLSHAEDLEVEALAHDVEETQRVLEVRVEPHQLQTTLEHRRSRRYRLHNAGGRPKTIVIEHPRPEVGWEIESPRDPLEGTDDLVRFQLVVAPEQSSEIVIVELRTERLTQSWRELSMERLRELKEDASLADEGRRVVEEIIEAKLRAEETTSSLARLDGERVRIEHDQERIRANMHELDRAGELYQRYLESLVKQEDRLMEIATEHVELTERARLETTRLNELLGVDPTEPSRQNDSPDPFRGVNPR